ncbi:MAG: helix-turn-helix domain-containing protein [Akkermansiaceae bacterium]
MSKSIQEIFAMRLHQARKIENLSLRELSEAVGGEPSHTMISRYEKAETIPGGEVVAKLALALKKSVDFFFRAYEVEFSELSFRKKAKLSVGERRAIEEKARDFFSRYVEAEELVGQRLPCHPPFAGEELTDADGVEEYAERLRSPEYWDIGNNPVPNLHQLIESNGIKVHEVDTEDQNFDGFSGKANGAPIIVLAKWLDRNIPWKRMTAAHELGHVVLPIPEHLPEREQEDIVKPFAGAFLLPKKNFIEMFGKQRSRISLGELIDLKAYYGVSIMAIMYRASQLGLISQAYSKRFFMMANKARWRSEGEPGDDSYRGEESHGRLRQLVFQGVAEGEMSNSKGAALLDKDMDEFRGLFKESYV